MSDSNKLGLVGKILTSAICRAWQKYVFSETEGGGFLDLDLIFGVFTPLSTIFQPYHDDQF